MLREPGLRDALLRPRQPRLDDELLELVPIDPLEVRDPHEHRGVPVEVRRREVDAAVVGEEEVLRVEVGDAEHEHVAEPLARLRVLRVRPPAAVEAVELPVHLVGGPLLVPQLLRRLRHRERQLVEVGHRRHVPTLPASVPPVLRPTPQR